MALGVRGTGVPASTTGPVVSPRPPDFTRYTRPFPATTTPSGGTSSAPINPRNPQFNPLAMNSGWRNQYVGAVEQAAAQSRRMDQAVNYYAGQAGPQLAQLGLSDAQLGLQRGQLQANQALQTRYLGEDQAFGNRQHDLQLAGLNIDRGAANRDLGYLSQLMGMNTTDLSRRLGFVDQYQGLANQSADRQLNYVDQRRGFENEGLGLDIGDIQEQYEREMRAQRDDAAARGAGTSTGNRSAVEDIGQDRQYRLATRLLASKATKAGLTDEQFGIREQLARQLLGFSEQRGELNSQYARDQLGLNNQKAATKDQLRHLDIRAQEVGLSRDQMQSAIQRQLESSKLDMFFGVSDVMNALGSNDIQRQQMAEQILRQAVANQQYFGG